MSKHLNNIILNSKKITTITRILITEHLREPTALLWSAIAPCILFVLAAQKNQTLAPTNTNYTALAAWFYSYISASVAFFGFSFYLIGRRESGFTRSFIYQRDAIKLFLISHTLTYSTVSTLYSSLFYLVTKPLLGHYSLTEFWHLTACFYTSYLIFICIGLTIAALPIKFSTASTIFSLMSFLMLLSGYFGAAQEQDASHPLTLLNPLYLSTKIFYRELPLLDSFFIALTTSLAAIYLTGRYFRVHPIWSRY